MRGKTFKIDTSAIGRLGTKLGQRTADYDKLIEKRVTRSTQMVWAVAHQKRAMISAQQAKAEGRRYETITNSKGQSVRRIKRVSDPNAQLGVPVRTGTLQTSIKQKISRNKFMSFRGEVSTKGVKYAPMIEYGTSKMRARPFMRPAINLTKDAIKRLFGLKAESNL